MALTVFIHKPQFIIRIWQNYYFGQFYCSRVEAFGSSHFCVSFSCERKFERIEGKFKHKIPTLDTDRHVKSDDKSKYPMIFVATTTQFWSEENISCINLFVAFKKKLISFTSEMEYSGGRNGCSILDSFQGFTKQILLGTPHS